MKKLVAYEMSNGMTYIGWVDTGVRRTFELSSVDDRVAMVDAVSVSTFEAQRACRGNTSYSPLEAIKRYYLQQHTLHTQQQREKGSCPETQKAAGKLEGKTEEGVGINSKWVVAEYVLKE